MSLMAYKKYLEREVNSNLQGIGSRLGQCPCFSLEVLQPMKTTWYTRSHSYGTVEEWYILKWVQLDTTHVKESMEKSLIHPRCQWHEAARAWRGICSTFSVAVSLHQDRFTSVWYQSPRKTNKFKNKAPADKKMLWKGWSWFWITGSLVR